jgi:hypothetical protein
MARRQQSALQAVAVATGKSEVLDKLEQWTEEPAAALAPAEPAPVAAKPRRAKTVKGGAGEVAAEAPAAPEPPPRPKRPWEEPSPDATHPYHVILSERLFRKMDFAWKRKGYKSAREFTLMALEAAADQALKELGEAP